MPGLTLRPCPICDVATPRDRVIGELEKTFPKQTELTQYKLTYCACRELIFQSPAPSQRDYDLMYKETYQFKGIYRDAEFAQGASTWFTNTLYKILTETHGEGITFSGLKLLEIGSGLAWMCQAAKSLDPGFMTLAQDISAEAADECPWADRYLVADVADPAIDSLAPFDVISMTHVIEHLLDPVSMLRRLSSLLSPTGIIFVTAPHRPTGWSASSDISDWREYSYNHVPAHIQYFSEGSFSRAVRRAGLSVARFTASADNEVFEACVRHPDTQESTPSRPSLRLAIRQWFSKLMRIRGTGSAA